MWCVSVHRDGTCSIPGGPKCELHTWRTCHKTGRGTADQRLLLPRRQWPCRGRNSHRASVRAMPNPYWRARKAPRTDLLGHHHHLTERKIDMENEKKKKSLWFVCSKKTQIHFFLRSCRIIKKRDRRAQTEKSGGKTGSIRMIKNKLHLSWKAEGRRGSLWEFKWEKEDINKKINTFILVTRTHTKKKIRMAEIKRENEKEERDTLWQQQHLNRKLQELCIPDGAQK